MPRAANPSNQAIKELGEHIDDVLSKLFIALIEEFDRTKAIQLSHVEFEKALPAPGTGRFQSLSLRHPSGVDTLEYLPELGIVRAWKGNQHSCYPVGRVTFMRQADAQRCFEIQEPELEAVG